MNQFLVLWGVLAFHVPQIWLMFFLHTGAKGAGGFFDASVDIMLFVLWAGIHSLLARDFSKRHLVRIFGEDYARLVYVSVAGITQCGLIYFWRPLDGIIWETAGFGYAILTTAFLFATGFVYYAAIQLDFMEALGIRALIRKIKGQRTQKMEFVVRGPYRYCRHPVYFGTIFYLWIGPVMTSSRFLFAVLCTAYLVVGTKLEDRETMKVLGEPYSVYARHVPMLIPRLSPWKGDLKSAS